MKSIGLGCLHFSVKSSHSSSFSVKDYISEVESSLKELPTVSDIAIDYDEDYSEEILTVGDGISMNDGEPCFPQIPSFELSFYLYLPFRVQSDLINIDESLLNTETELFHVTFRHSWHGPVTYIDCIDASESCKPSTSVQIVREYLKREYKKLDTYLYLDFVGPSPFHSELYIQEDSSLEPNLDVFAFSHEKKPGYDRLLFKFKGLDEGIALRRVIQLVEDELAFYYVLSVLHTKQIIEWDMIREDFEELISSEDKINSYSLLKIIKRNKLIRNLYKRIGIFKGSKIYADGYINSQYNDLYRSGKHHILLQTFVDRKLKGWATFPINETADVVSYFDSKGSKSIELLVIFIAAICGGVTGALLTILFAK
ncbi:hypothetical protein [Vibrio owensii]|uniref:hypothetical protein n=1 Tax=Vibrio harveyi group TaxID=717610 RepID=UPI0018F1255B|nr:hypothetical protein [Vibrio owensii]EGR0804064.1 hypothetical protein [Vibrio alginolyticus]EJC7121667.1 hypothetical protein [Vibrio parahaemolyticus]